MTKHIKDPVLDIPADFRGDKELDQLENSADIDKLRTLLDKDEVVYRLVVGFNKDSNGVLAATNRRIIYADKRFITSKVVQFTYGEIATIVYAKHLMSYQITLTHASGSFTIDQVDKVHGQRFIDLVGTIIGDDYVQDNKMSRVFAHRGDILELEDLAA